MIDTYDVLIVGAGHGGAQTAIALRKRGFEGSIAIVGDEPWLPYERPPLSKEYLAGEKTFERILIRPQAFWQDRQIDIVTSRRVVGLDPAGHQATLEDGTTLGYGSLVWAAGGAARRLSCDGHELAGVHAVRSKDDVDRLASELADGPEIVIIGGGYIGLEAAAALVKRGHRPTLLESQDRVLARVAGEPLSRFFEAEHRAHGVDLRTGVSVAGLQDDGDTRVTAVQLSGGEILRAGVVIVGIGIVPAIAPLASSGAQAADGVVVDGYCRTSLPDVFAIGDCAAHRNEFASGRLIRLESVQNATDQASIVADALCGEPRSYSALPWFWSDQYDLKLQTLGLSADHDRAVLRGSTDERRFSVGYFKARRLIAIDCVNSIKDYVQARSLIVGGAELEPTRFADTALQLKDL